MLCVLDVNMLEDLICVPPILATHFDIFDDITPIKKSLSSILRCTILSAELK